MKKYILWLILVLVGFFIGAGIYSTSIRHFRGAAKTKSDTVYIYDTIKYSRLELAVNTYTLNVPSVNISDLVFIPETSLDTIYRDNIRYVTLPRQYFHTTTPDAEIWHSGVDSKIDSLVVFRKTEKVTQSVVPKTKRHGLSVGIEAKYAESFRIPVQLEYSYNVKPWLSVYGYVEYELLTRRAGAGIGTKLTVSW